MIHEVDESLQELIRREVLNGADVEVSFEAPTKEWAARRNTPTLNVYLYDIREDLERRGVEFEPVRNEAGRVVSLQPPPRHFKLSYLITAWTQRPEDEHRLLSAVMGCFLKQDILPKDVLTGSLAETHLQTVTQIGLPPPKDRNMSDVWSALGGELKPSLDLIVIAPYDPARVKEVGPPVLEEPRIKVVRPDAEAETAGGRRRKAAKEEEEAEKAAPEETVQAGTEDQPGRIVHVRDMSGDERG